MNQRERDRLERRRQGDRRFFVRLFGFLAGLFVLGLIAIVYVLGFTGKDFTGEGEGHKLQPAATQVSTTETQAAQPPVSAGKDLFTSTCGSCHTLAAAGTTGAVGPNLDDLKPDQATVQAAIKNGGTGSGVMPANLLTGTQAEQVAAFVAANAGR